MPSDTRNFDLIAFDLDGTVFAEPTDQFPTPRVSAVLQAAHDAGAVVAIASGRPCWMLGARLPRAPWLDWAISCNGARVAGVHDCAGDFDASFPRDLAETVLRTIDELGGTMSIHTDCETLMEKRHVEKRVGPDDPITDVDGVLRGNPIDAFTASLGSATVISALDEFRARPYQQLDKVDCAMPSRSAADELEARLTQLGGVGIARLDARNFELTSSAASKGLGVEELCRRLGIDPARAVAFGDSGNDLSMTGRAITFVAMGNAVDEVKAAADDICPSVSEDGVAQWLETHLF